MQELTELEGFAFDVFVSRGSEEPGSAVVNRVARAYDYYLGLFDVRPRFRLVVLNEADWPAYAGPGAVPYGMPNLTEDFLVAALGGGEYWLHFVRYLDEAVPGSESILLGAYGYDGQIDLSSYFELNVLHELAHLFHEAVPFGFPLLMLRELFVSLAQHAYVATHEPDALPALETFPQLLSGIDASRFRYRSLRDYERLYTIVGYENYFWFWSKLQVAAKGLFEAGGEDVLRRLWTAFAAPDDEVVRKLESDVHPEAARLLRSFAAGGG
jgi:hypothetical protein